MSDTLGGRIEQARGSKGYSISQLAHRLGVKPVTLRSWEADGSEPRANKLLMLGGLLGVSSRWLLEGQADDAPVHYPAGETSEVMQKLDQAFAMHQRLVQILHEISSDVGRLQRQIDEEQSHPLN